MVTAVTVMVSSQRKSRCMKRGRSSNREYGAARCEAQCGVDVQRCLLTFCCGFAAAAWLASYSACRFFSSLVTFPFFLLSFLAFAGASAGWACAGEE